MKRILVPTDFSEPAYHALEYALRLGEKMGFGITICHAYSIPYAGASSLISINDILEKRAKEDLAALKAKVQKQPEYKSIDIHYESQFGSVADVVQSMLARTEHRFVIMGTRGASGLKGTLLGSNASAVMKKAKCPVLAIPEHANFEIPKRIVIASDLSGKIDADSLEVLTEITRVFDSEVDVVNIKHPKDAATVATPGEGLSGYTYHQLEHEDVEEGIQLFIQQQEANLLVMVKHRYNFLERLLRHSVTKDMTLHTKMPLLILHG